MIFDDLPPPQIIDEKPVEAILDEIMLDVQSRFDNAGIEYTVGALETDPVKILAEAYAYRERLIYEHINLAYVSHLIDYASGASLDHLAKFYDTFRMADETDARLRRRTKLAIVGRSAAGPEERYMAIAMGADVRVRDVRVWREGRDPTLNVAVLSTLEGGDASPELLEIVSLALNEKRVASDRFSVVSAVTISVDVSMRLRLSAAASIQTLEDMETRVKTLWERQDLLGLDLTEAFLIAATMGGDVTDARVLAPTHRIVANPNEAVKIASVSVEFEGRGR